MRKAGILLLFLAVAFGPSRILGQVLPIGQWQSHFNYRSAQQVVHAGPLVYCASYNGLFTVNTTNGDTRALSKADGLSNTGISAMGYSPDSKLLLLAYRNGVIDFVFLNEQSEPDQIETWDLLNNTQGLPANKAIRRIVFRDELAYIASSFGVLVLDSRLKQVEETYRYIGTNGAQIAVSDLAFGGDSLFVTTSQGNVLATSMRADVNRQYFANWKSIPAPGNVTSIAAFGNAIYAAVSGKGIYLYEKGSWKLVYANVSTALRLLDSGDVLTATTGTAIVNIGQGNTTTTLTNPLFTGIRAGLRADGNAWWVADPQNGLVTNQFGAFKPISPAQTDTTISPRPDSVITDLAGLSWTRLPEALGGGIIVSNADGSRKKVLSTSIGNGSLPASKINSLALDTDGYVWFASAKGAGYFIPDGVLEASRVDALLPIYGQRRLFNNEECTAIAVEPGNRKWIGTRTGLYQFSADGTELVRKFTAADSPLPSDMITALRFEGETGLLFIDTPAGMVSYQTDSKTAAERLADIRIFPNPVRPGYSGNVGISGLTAQSTVKITDLAGRLVFETRSEGGMASWNLNDYTGRRARGGIYMVFVVGADGNERQAGKLAIIN
ncbi:hypothetical protein GCM10010967_05720 [Dyadobacter beijingensis]|uniref:PorZ N-terminal beta-propeller domain-containing protein n=1 Tax=Dyadobacter beijingensis TaxID=365489 RepID=A0ABQ2HD85_9BACT|nr:hypothetical protein [Dyadobacter beijingensis]GGM77001.1 hypothetical protein GCM10010967_05720 [Dyadobacter beijingensis]